jgi:hypothetical protein
MTPLASQKLVPWRSRRNVPCARIKPPQVWPVHSPGAALVFLLFFSGAELAHLSNSPPAAPLKKQTSA